MRQSTLCEAAASRRHFESRTAYVSRGDARGRPARSIDGELSATPRSLRASSGYGQIGHGRRLYRRAIFLSTRACRLSERATTITPEYYYYRARLSSTYQQRPTIATPLSRAYFSFIYRHHH